MVRFLFAFVFLVHGCIHLTGFAKAFGYGNFTQFSKEISRAAGLAWLLAAVLLILAALFYIFRKNSWWIWAVPAIIISQVLIIFFWKDAKLGSVINIILLIAAIVGYADWNFNRMIKKEVTGLFALQQQPSNLIPYNKIAGLPPIIQRWLKHSGITGQNNIHSLRLKQKGVMITKPAGKWLDFTATQYFNADNPAFNWQTKVSLMPLIYLTGRDKFENGEGEMLIKLLSLKNVVEPGHTIEITQGTMLRYLAEICWFPAAAIQDYISWEEIGPLAARATMTYNNIRVSGTFFFNADGDMTAFEAMRYGEFDGRSSLEKWHVDSKDYRTFSGIRVPSSVEITWKLKEGDFTWMKIALTDLEFNISKMY